MYLPTAKLAPFGSNRHSSVPAGSSLSSMTYSGIGWALGV